MAHADYNCCAVCDSKMEYSGGDAATKERLCEDCVRAVHGATGKLILSADDMLTHMKSIADDGEALAFLKSIGFDPCYYTNDLDAYLIERGLIETGVDGCGKWGKRLRYA